MSAWWKALHFIAFCAFLGAPVWWCGVWSALESTLRAPLMPQIWRRVRGGLLCGAVCFVVSGFAEAFRAASQVVEPGHPVPYWDFLVGTRYGQMTLLKACLTPVVYGSVLLLQTGWQRLAHWGTWGGALGLLWSMAYAGHMTAKPGLAPLLTALVHLLGAVLWGGGVGYMLLLPWRALRQQAESSGRLLWKLLERLSSLALVGVLLLLGSGMIMAFIQVYGVPALRDTPYGRTLVLKIVLVLLAFAPASWQLLRLTPALKRQARSGLPSVLQRLLGRCAVLLRLEAGLILGTLAAAGWLTTLPPAERPAQVEQATWHASVGDWPLTVIMQPVGEAGQVQFGMSLAAGPGRALPGDMPLDVHLRMREHEMGTSRQTVAPTAPGRYTMPGVLSMAGTWELGLGLHLPGQEKATGLVVFEAATGLLEQDRTRRLDLAAVQASTTDMLSFLLGLLFALLALVTLWASRCGRVPVWGTPFGFVLMLCAGYLVLRVLLVDAYPTTYIRNPLPASATALGQGQHLFQEHCIPCHGVGGRGDGPAATGLQPPPADLTAAHVEDHTDGTLFWWLSHGMPGTAMPAWESQLSEPERWATIHYIRSLRAARP